MRRDSGSIKVWDLPLRLFHWILAAAITVAFLSAEEGSPLSAWHIPAGWTVAVLLAFRLIWGFVGGEHARFRDFIRPSRIGRHISDLVRGRREAPLGHNPLGGLAVLGLLGLAGAAVATGIGLERSERFEEVHEMLAYMLLAMIALHVAAVLLMSAVTRENLVRAMLTGRKRLDLHPGARDAVPPKIAASAAALAVIGLSAYGALLMDSAAFTPHAHEEGGTESPGAEEEAEDLE